MASGYRLWAGGDSELWYSDDDGSSWTQVGSLPGTLGGIWGPAGSPSKIYGLFTGPAPHGVHSWVEGVGWTPEVIFNPSPNIQLDWSAGFIPGVWCSDDDQLAFTTGNPGPNNNEIYARVGGPGAPWGPEHPIFPPPFINTIIDVHGTPDGSEVFALEKDTTNGFWNILRRVVGIPTQFLVAHSFPILTETIFQLRIVSATEVRLFGLDGTVVKVWLWNGVALSLEYSFDVFTLGATSAAWAGAWASADGQDAGISVNTSPVIQSVHLRRTAGVWALDDGNVRSGLSQTRTAGIQDAADDRLLFQRGEFMRRASGAWVDFSEESIGTWGGNLPDGYLLQWIQVPTGPGPEPEEEEPECVLPHRIYPMIIQSIRDADKDEGFLLKRWTEGMDAAWAITWCGIRDLPTLIDPEECPAEALEYLGWIVGLTKAMEGLTGGISESDLRQLIAIAVRMWKKKGSGLGLSETFRSVSGYDVRYLTWFFYRMLLDEFELAYAELDVDPWLLDQPGMQSQVPPDGVEVSRILTGDTLPSAETPAWTYVNEGLAEGAHFSIVPAGPTLSFIFQSTTSVNGGYYQLDDPELVDPETAQIATRWQAVTQTEVGGHPWFLELRDGTRGYRFRWSASGVVMHDSDGNLVAGPRPRGFSNGVEYRVRLARTGPGRVDVTIDGDSVFGELDVADFAASSDRRYAFGYLPQGFSQNWDAAWRDVGSRPILTFDVTTLLGEKEAVPHDVRVLYRGKTGIVAPSYWSGTRNEVSVHDALGAPLPLDLDLSNFTVGVDPDEFVSDLRVVDDGTLDREFAGRLAAVLRPANERIFVRFVDFQDVFRNRDLRYWEEISGTTATRPEDGRVDLEDAGAETVIHADMPLASTWSQFVAAAQFALRDDVAGKWGEVRFHVQDALNFHAVRIDPGARTVALQKVVAGARSTLVSHGPMDVFHPDVLYGIHVTTEDVVGGVLIKFYLDWVYLGEAVDAAFSAGTVGLAVEAGQRLSASFVDLVQCPFPVIRVGPGPELEPNWTHACAIP